MNQLNIGENERNGYCDHKGKGSDHFREAQNLYLRTKLSVAQVKSARSHLCEHQTRQNGSDFHGDLLNYSEREQQSICNGEQVFFYKK
jgi:hypothetical protein